MDDRSDDEILETLADKIESAKDEVSRLRAKVLHSERAWVIAALVTAEKSLANAEDQIRKLL